MFVWYVAVAHAMLASDDAMLLQLWQDALTCTIRVQVSTSVTKLALSAVEVSERYVRFADMADTFIQWAAKVQRIIDDIDGAKKLSSQMTANQLRDMGVRYRGTPVTKAMILSVGHVHERLDEYSFATLRHIEREFGRDVLSTNYTKLSRFMYVVKTHATSVAAPGKIKEVPPLSKHPSPLPIRRPSFECIFVCVSIVPDCRVCAVVLLGNVEWPKADRWT